VLYRAPDQRSGLVTKPWNQRVCRNEQRHLDYLHPAAAAGVR
jgi:hypothetical protein